MILRCAAYARYSSDRQSPASISDQLRKCREFAESQGWQLLDTHIYTDEALSGSGADRPGFLKLLKASSSLPKPFDIVLLDDTSRLSRDLGDTMHVFKQLDFMGIRIVAVSQGIDTQDDQSEVLMTVHGLFDNIFIKELSKKTHRGLEGPGPSGISHWWPMLWVHEYGDSAGGPAPNQRNRGCGRAPHLSNGRRWR